MICFSSVRPVIRKSKPVRISSRHFSLGAARRIRLLQLHEVHAEGRLKVLVRAVAHAGRLRVEVAGRSHLACR
jgi:hypothetical protein